jgi:hypothetical protein
MISQYFSGYFRLPVIILAGLLWFGAFPADAGDSEKPKKKIQYDIQPVGIITPDGAKSVWPVSMPRGADILGWLAQFPSSMTEGVKFYKLSSWRQTARMLTAVNQHQTQIIRQLAQDVQQLNKRVAILEKKRPAVVYSGPLDYRVHILEKKVHEMSDGGNP